MIECQGAEILRFLVRVHRLKDGQTNGTTTSRGDPLLCKCSPKTMSNYFMLLFLLNYLF